MEIALIRGKHHWQSAGLVGVSIIFPVKISKKWNYDTTCHEYHFIVILSWFISDYLSWLCHLWRSLLNHPLVTKKKIIFRKLYSIVYFFSRLPVDMPTPWHCLMREQCTHGERTPTANLVPATRPTLWPPPELRWTGAGEIKNYFLGGISKMHMSS